MKDQGCPRDGLDPLVDGSIRPQRGSSPKGDPLIGQQLANKYDITGILGIGGMGRVYEAFDRHLKRQVAIKVLAEHLIDAIFVSRFKREARASAATGHPNIVQVLDFGAVSDGRPFMVMELLQGRDLSAELNELCRLPLARAVDVVGQVLFALSAAHPAGIVHRDLKPGNIFLTERKVATWYRLNDPAGDAVKVLDFGLTRFTTSTGNTSVEITKTGVALGTLSYMAPEQIQNPSNVDGRTDLYSVAVILFCCLTGQKPFVSKTPYNVINLILGEPTPDIRAYDPALPGALSEVINRGMAKQRDVRFQTAEEFIEALRPFHGVGLPAEWEVEDTTERVADSRPPPLQTDAYEPTLIDIDSPLPADHAKDDGEDPFLSKTIRSAPPRIAEADDAGPEPSPSPAPTPSTVDDRAQDVTGAAAARPRGRGWPLFLLALVLGVLLGATATLMLVSSSR